MSDPQSSLVFSTGVEVIAVTVNRTVDRWRLRLITDDPQNSRARVSIDKGYLDEDSNEAWVAQAGILTIQNLSAATTISFAGNTYTVPSGAHYDTWAAYTDSEGLSETIEEATFEALENMQIASGTPTPA